MASTPLTQAAADLRTAAPGAFERFVQRFAEHTTEVTVAVTNATAADVLVEQGKAREARYLLQMLTECHLHKPPQPKQPVPPAIP